MPATKTRSDPLYVETWGSGIPVVFIHGLGASGRYWEPLRSALPAGYRGIAPDLLGFGRSPAPSDAAYDVDCHLAALETHIPSGSLIVAHSTGAILAAALAARRPDLTARLVLLGLPNYRDAATQRRSRGTGQRWPARPDGPPYSDWQSGRSDHVSSDVQNAPPRNRARAASRS